MEHFVDYYLRHPTYKEYPVVGVSWVQANDYCKWRTDRVNEYILCREGILDWEMNNKELNPFHMFNTEAYLAGQYFGMYPQPRESSRDYSTEDEEEEEEDDDEEIGKDEKFTKQSKEDNGRRLKNYNPSYQSSNVKTTETMAIELFVWKMVYYCLTIDFQLKLNGNMQRLV